MKWKTNFATQLSCHKGFSLALTESGTLIRFCRELKNLKFQNFNIKICVCIDEVDFLLLMAHQSHLSGCFWLFALKIYFGRWQGPMNGTLSFYKWRFSGGDTTRWWDTQILPYAKAFVRTFCTHRQQGCKIFRCEHLCHGFRPSHLVEFLLPNFYFTGIFIEWDRDQPNYYERNQFCAIIDAKDTSRGMFSQKQKKTRTQRKAWNLW